MIGQRRQWTTAPWMPPLFGIVVGAVGGAVYWLGALVWPSSIAVILSMIATELAGAALHRGADSVRASADGRAVWIVFVVLAKYNALMALTAASLPFALPANAALGLIMIAGHASSRALAGDLGIGLALGFAPAVLLGIPGLVGLAAAVLARIAFILARRRLPLAGQDMARPLAEVCFYLGAVAAWAYA
jgi:hypothetical protein